MESERVAFLNIVDEDPIIYKKLVWYDSGHFPVQMCREICLKRAE